MERLGLYGTNRTLCAMPAFLDVIPEPSQGAVANALVAVFGSAQPTIFERVTGGASGAFAWRIEVAGKSYLLRVEGRRSPFRNPHQYTCMRIAAEAAIAPPLHYIDADAGIALMDFILPRPLESFPGGRAALLRAAGGLVAQLQSAVTFPRFVDYIPLLARMLSFVRNSNLFTPGLLDRHVDGFERIRAAYPKDVATVSSHNDPNPRNILFDGARLWLIDWETAYANDPLVDIAILLDQLATTPEAEDALLSASLGRRPDGPLRARLLLMRPLTRLYYAGLSFAASGAAREAPDADLSAPTPAAFRHAVAEGRINAAGPEMLYVLGKMQLAGFLEGLAAPGFEEALETLRHG